MIAPLSHRWRVWFALLLTLVLLGSAARAEDGYRLWLRYDPIADSALRQAYARSLTEIVMNEPPSRFGAATLAATRDELVRGLHGLLGTDVPVVAKATRDGALLVGTPENPDLLPLVSERDLRAASEEGYILRHVVVDGHPRVLLMANHNIGLLYGAFALLRELQLNHPIDHLDMVSAPRIQRRLLNHWDDLNRFVERGYAGRSLWEWFQLPDYVDPRYRDYGRANASLGINGTVLNNVNADPLILTSDYLRKVAAIANALRPYGMRVYLSVRFSAPVEVGDLTTADPFDPAVQRWWSAKADEIYRLIPDFGGFLVKANSEGQPGPQNYGRTHADGANMMADALVPHGGVVIWRAFVYDDKNHEDRAKQAYDEFKPLDGKFHSNVIIQVKNGPIDFMPREPFHPLFGAMPRTPLSLELQITQEYLGGSIHLAHLGPMWKEVLDSDTHADGPGSTVGRIVDGSLEHHGISMIAGVANIGTDRNWCGHPLDAANWYAFGRLAWDYTLGTDTIADEWTRMTFSNDPRVVRTITKMLLESREAVVNYEMPLGLHHIMASDHHYGPGPWVNDMKRADWNPTYYHRADAEGLGFDRTATGSNALAQYAPPVAKAWGDLATCPDTLLLWFHHVPWTYRMRSGRTMWDELCLHYQHGVDTVREWQKSWDALHGSIDDERWSHVKVLLARQEREARQWRDACTQYFQTFSKLPLPVGVEPPEHPLAYYEAIKLHYVPGSAEAK
ncbi:MAG TPA: alpha-glucuronidase family glycosyl hydrolase [Opitutaceae bacterium]|nr:alpha-glucuronidase family glycosyl hydrolase [Opitutaceae bacterium]